MILYYNAIDPVDGLTPGSSAGQITDSPVVCAVLFS